MTKRDTYMRHKWLAVANDSGLVAGQRFVKAKHNKRPNECKCLERLDRRSQDSLTWCPQQLFPALLRSLPFESEGFLGRNRKGRHYLKNRNIWILINIYVYLKIKWSISLTIGITGANHVILVVFINTVGSAIGRQVIDGTPSETSSR